jgi:UMF1 family MFS transporter
MSGLAAEAARDTGLTVAGTRPASTLGQFSWALYQWARDPYFLIVNIYVFAPYFSNVVVGDPVKGQALWGYTTSVAAVFMALFSPVLGAIADAGGRRKPWILACTVISLPCMWMLWFATPGMGAEGGTGLWVILLALILAALMSEFSSVFHNAMLPGIASERRLGALSGLGLALTNLGGIITLLIVLLAFTQAETPLFGLDRALHEHDRVVGPLSGRSPKTGSGGSDRRAASAAAGSLPRRAAIATARPTAFGASSSRPWAKSAIACRIR